MDSTRELLIASRHGVVLRSELRALGLSPYLIRGEVRAGIWQESGKSVLVHRSAIQGLRTDTLIAAKRNPDAILTGTSAALLRPHPVWTGRFRSRQAMIIAPVHRRGPWLTVGHPGAGFDIIDGMRVADPLTTLIDLLRFLPWRDAAAVAGAANQQGMFGQELLDSAVRSLRKTAGSAQLRRLVQGMARGAESGPEIDLHIALLRARIRGWVANPVIHFGKDQFRPDVAFMRERIALEYDGEEEHSLKKAFHHDRERDNTFQLRGDWKVARLTSESLYEPSALQVLFADLRADLRRRGRRVR